MRLLLDTHIVLWALADDDRLASPLRELIVDGRNDVLVSAASVWEIAIKATLGKLDAPGNLLEALTDAQLQPLPIEHGHAVRAGRLPRHHDDPFDRMLVAQAAAEGLTLVSTDRRLSTYGVDLLPA